MGKLVRRLVFGNGMTFESMADFLTAEFWNRRFASVGVVPAARAVPSTKQKEYEDHVRGAGAAHGSHARNACYHGSCGSLQ